MMAKEALGFGDFLINVSPAYQESVTEIDGYLLGGGCKRKVEPAKSGTRASYSINKRALLNFVFRKSGLLARVYGDHVATYAGLPDSFPESMSKAMAKAGDCKRMTVGPDACSPSCSMGYDFTANGVHYQKCRYSCFLFPVTEESLPFIRALVENELAARAR